MLYYFLTCPTICLYEHSSLTIIVVAQQGGDEVRMIYM